MRKNAHIPERLAHLPPQAARFIQEVEESGPFGDDDGSFYCEIDADVCEELCQFLVACFGRKGQLLAQHQINKELKGEANEKE
jgi:hypothetical protein